jgi:hypothetical protein
LFFWPVMKPEMVTLYGFVRAANNRVDAVPKDVRGSANFVKRYRVSLAADLAEKYEHG